MKRFRVHWSKSDRVYRIVIASTGAEIARVDEINEAWQIAEALEREAVERLAARKEQQDRARAVRTARLRSARQHRAGVRA